MHFPTPLSLLLLGAGALALPASPQAPLSVPHAPKDAQVLVLGGGMAGITAARALHAAGVTDVVVVEAGAELGGRMQSHRFGARGREYTVELGANWVQGTRRGDGPENPVWTLAKKHGLKTQKSKYFDGLTTYNESGQVDFRHHVKASSKNFDRLVASAGMRVPEGLVDASARTGYSLTGSHPHTAEEMAAEYYQFDWEFTTSPEESSWLACAWNNNHTFDTFSEVNLMSLDGRGFKTLVQAEAAAFLKPSQIRLNSVVTRIKYDAHGVEVTLADDTTLTAEYVICTFSLGVLQHGDVEFEPALPSWKVEAIHSMTMGEYTKIFLQFPENFWFPTETALFASRTRGRYPVWQSLDHAHFLPGSGILFGTVTGAFARRIAALPRAQVLQEVLDTLRTMFPGRAIPPPDAFFYKPWGADPRFRGAYATWPPGFVAEHHVNLRADVGAWGVAGADAQGRGQEAGRVWFAGEAGSLRYFGYLHGAYFEGADIGARVAQCVLRRGDCRGLEHVEVVRNVRPYGGV
ncbi:amine oxidase [Phanerochaete sordida]|uniref:Amine oxidase n=1 Tax=Phanerochaete sordida TaxID=48140 RepID=A0A9P3GLN2_9APHY|nr:amine oxidase [Phanerochaete sordida]